MFQVLFRGFIFSLYLFIGMHVINEKYCGDVTLIKTINSGRIGSKRIANIGQADRYMVLDNHPPIIDRDIFEMVQEEKARRSNIEMTAQGRKRKASRYSSRQFEKYQELRAT